MTDGMAAGLAWMPPLLRDPFAATVAAEAATWPLMLASFHQVSLIAPATNALVLPLLPAVMIVGGGGALIGAPQTMALPMLPIAAALASWPVLQAAGVIVSWFRLVIEHAGSLPLAAVVMPYFPPRWLAVAAILNGGALLGIKLRQLFWQRKVWAALGAGTLAVVALLLIAPDGRVHVYALDVGTGSAGPVRPGDRHHELVEGRPRPRPARPANSP